MRSLPACRAFYGLYATIVPLIAYAVFGPSRILVLGPDSRLRPIILAVVVAQSASDPARAVAIAGAMAIVSGLVCILAGVLKLGFITELLSKPIRYGYMNGIALMVLISQLPKLLGFSVEADGPLRSLSEIGTAIWAGKINWTSPCHRRRRAGNHPAAEEQQAAARRADRGDRRHGGCQHFRSVGAAAWPCSASARGPAGLQRSLARASPTSARCWSAARRLRWFRFADTSVLSRAYAARLGHPVDPNQEMVGLGAANLAAGLFQGFPISSSSSRTPVAEAAGAKTQLTGVVGALGVAALLVAAPDLLKHLPTPALAAVVIASAIGLFEVADLRRIWRIQRWEFWLSIAVLGRRGGAGRRSRHRAGHRGRRHRIPVGRLAAALGGPRPRRGGQGLARHHALPGRPPDPRPAAVPLGCAAVLRQCRAVRGKRYSLPWMRRRPEVRQVVVAAAPVTSVDVTAADALAELDDKLVSGRHQAAASPS